MAEKKLDFHSRLDQINSSLELLKTLSRTYDFKQPKYKDDFKNYLNRIENHHILLQNELNS